MENSRIKLGIVVEKGSLNELIAFSPYLTLYYTHDRR